MVVVCPHYDAKQWTDPEWTAIHDLLSHRKHREVMLCRFDRAFVRRLGKEDSHLQSAGKLCRTFAGDGTGRGRDFAASAGGGDGRAEPSSQVDRVI